MSKFFLYNGVKLPALPEWDKTVYPYAFIYIVTLDGTTGVYTLVVSSSSVMNYDGNGIICPAATVGQRYTVSEDSWTTAAGSDDFYIKRDNLIYTVWANFDVLNSDGSVYVAASEPVPVAGKFPLREWVGWLIAGLCSRPLPMSTREPVAYLYNGVRLPRLPEYDTTTLPYVGIFTRDGAYYCYPKSSVSTVSYDGTTTIITTGYKCENGGWVKTGGGFGNVPIWANYDVKYNDSIENVGGSVFLAASEPVPVYK